MPKKILILACTLLLGGCAIPVPLQVASWAIDGLLFVTTEKMMADHGVSLATQRDCAMLRIVTEGALCRESDPPGAVTVALLPSLLDGNSADGIFMTSAGDDVAERLAAFATAAGRGPEPALPDTDQRAVQVALVAEAPLDTADLAAARGQTISDAPSFFDYPIEPIGRTAFFEPTPGFKPERMAERAVEPSLGLGSDTLEAIGDALDSLMGDDRLYLGDTGHEPALSGADAITLLGGAGDDILGGRIGGDPGSPPNGRGPPA